MKRKLSIIFNILIIVFELIGFIITFNNNGRIPVEYYTEDSNILAFFTSLIFVIYLCINKEIPKYLKILKYISVVCLTITFLVVIFILTPMYNFDYNFLLFNGEMFYHHVVCPMLCVISFIFFDKLDIFTKKENFLAVLVTIFYGIVMLMLNIFNIIVGPYPFLMIYKQSVFATIMWDIILLSLAYLIALLFGKIKNYMGSREY